MATPLFRLTAGRLNITIAASRAHTHQVSVHGTSAHVEIPGTNTRVERVGQGTYIYGIDGELVWTHFSVPVPLLIDDSAPLLTRIFFFFKAENAAAIRHVHLYDGVYRFKVFNIDDVDGDFSHTFNDTINRLTVSRTIRYALGISLGFQFPKFSGGSTPPLDPVVWLHGAGAEYLT